MKFQVYPSSAMQFECFEVSVHWNEIDICENGNHVKSIKPHVTWIYVVRAKGNMERWLILPIENN